MLLVLYCTGSVLGLYWVCTVLQNVVDEYIRADCMHTVCMAVDAKRENSLIVVASSQF